MVVASGGNHGDDSGDYHVTSSVGSNGVYYGSVGDGNNDDTSGDEDESDNW